MTNIYTGIRETGIRQPFELPRPATHELHFIIENGVDLVSLCQWARQQNYYFCTMVVSDERLLEDHVYKLYYVLSAPDGKLVILEHPLTDPENPTQYVSIKTAFAAVEPLEKEAQDLFGLSPRDYTLNNGNGFVLHPSYPLDLYPLRRTRLLEKLPQKVGEARLNPPLKPLPEGMLYLPVGPIHAGVIEAGNFRFHIAGEVVEDLEIRLGYKHKGIEKLFETKYTLESGVKLAERISGDSSFAHSMAYCQAVETLAGVKPPKAALYWRGLFLELERLCNHIGDVAALVHDMAFDLVSSQIAVLRETAVQLNYRLTGHRLLRGVNCPGGIALTHSPNLDDAWHTMDKLTNQFFNLSELVLNMPACRDRAIGIGILTEEQAQKTCGATGLVARASGLREHDFRVKHPQGVYTLQPELRDFVEETIVSSDDMQGDVFARLALRVAEVKASKKIVKHLLDKRSSWQNEPRFEPITNQLKAIPTFAFGLGYVEGWRGDVFYWVTKGPDNSIFRCKVRDPSVFNWPALRLAVIRNPKTKNENLLADFPLINKSFNLSYSGHDL